MARNLDAVDCVYLWTGDYNIGSDGDLADTNADQIQSLQQEIQSICASELSDWAEYANLGATLSDFIGQPNTAITAQQIQTRIIDSLVNFNIVQSSDITVTVIPVGPYSLFIVIRVLAQATANNSLTDNIVATSLIFNTQEHSIFFVDSSGLLVGT